MKGGEHDCRTSPTDRRLSPPLKPEVQAYWSRRAQLLSVDWFMSRKNVPATASTRLIGYQGVILP